MKQFLFTIITTTLISMANAQNVGIGTTTPNSSAILDVSSTTKGMLMPRMSTTQRNAIVSPAQGLTILNTDDKCIDIYDGTNWIKNCGYKQGDSAAIPANSWVQKADFGAGARDYAVGFSIGNKAYIGTGANVNNKKDFWEYDPTNNVWTQKADFGGTARSGAVGFSIGIKGYIGTGDDGFDYKKDFWEYDPSNNTWTQKANFGGTARSKAVGFSIGSKGYIGTGYDNVFNKNDFWEYDPVSNGWTQKTDVGGTGRYQAVGFSIGSKAYIGTGYNDNTGNKNDFWEYDPISNVWTQKADFAGSARYGAVGFSIGSEGYVGTGYDNYGVYNKDFWEYNPLGNLWTQKANFKGEGRYAAVGFSIGNKGYIGTGIDNVSSKKDFWEYNKQQFNIATYAINSPTLANANITDGIWTKKVTGEVYTNASKLGIGTTTPKTRLHVADSSVVFTGQNTLPITASDPPISGSGNRMMWYADKASFRVGGVNGINWDKGNIGNFSFSSGYNTKAAGGYSTSMGASTIASGVVSTSMGDGTIAKAYGSLSIGTNNDPYDNPGTTLGANDRIFQIGNGNFINPSNAMTVLRNGNVGIGSLAPSQKLVVKGSNADVMLVDGGNGMYATFAENGTPRGFIGSYNGNDEDFQIGTFGVSTGTLNLTTNSEQRLSVLFNGNVGIGTTTPNQKLVVKGSNPDVMLIDGGSGMYTLFSENGTPRGFVGSYNGNDEDFQIGTYSASTGTLNLTTNSEQRLSVLFNGNVGIGTTTPQARLHVADSSVLFTAQTPNYLTPENPPISGAGSRMMWYAGKSAFRAGSISDTAWDKQNVGFNSFASGYNTKASGVSSTSMGDNTVASGDFSTSMGGSTKASGTYSTSIGTATIASELAATSMGNGTQARGINSTSMGVGTIAIGNSATSMGFFTLAGANFSTSMGNYTKAKSNNSLVIGKYNDTTATDRLFEIGNGTADNARGNALTVLDNGNVGIGTTTPTSRLAINGQLTVDQKAIGGYGGLLLKGNVPGSNYPNIAFTIKNNAATPADVVAAMIQGDLQNNTAGAETVDLTFLTSQTGLAGLSEKFRIKGNGNVGIGTSTPTNKLSLNGNANFTGNVGIGTTTPTTAKLVISGAPGTEGIDLSSTDQYANMRVIRNNLFGLDKDMFIGYQSGLNSTLHLYSNNNETVTVKNGNLGIGTNAPVTKLDLNGGDNWDLTNSEGDMRIGNANYRIKMGVALNGGGAGAGRIRAVGGINTLYLGSGTTDVLTLFSNGNATLVGVLTQSSDARLKKNIVPLTLSLNKLTQLNGYTYNWISKDKDPNQQIGLIAQEVQKLYPQLVSEVKGENGETTLAVNYTGLIPVMIESIKEQQKQIDELKLLVQKLLNK
jgi:Chaperone of endosialidase